MKIGRGCKISDKASFYENEGTITIGDNVRIDDFCLFSTGGNGSIYVGNHIHFAAYCGVWGGGGIIFADLSQFATKCTFLSKSDDWSGHSLIGPCVPDKYKPGLKSAQIYVGEHVVVGAGSVVLPGVTIGEGAAIGAMSLVKWNVLPWGIYAGIPAKLIKQRSSEMKGLAKEFLVDHELMLTVEGY